MPKLVHRFCQNGGIVNADDIGAGQRVVVLQAVQQVGEFRHLPPLVFKGVLLGHIADLQHVVQRQEGFSHGLRLILPYIVG